MKTDDGNPFVRRWLGNEKDFDSAIDMASGTTKEQRQKQFDETFKRASQDFVNKGFINTHPRLLEVKAQLQIDCVLDEEKILMPSEVSHGRNITTKSKKETGNSSGKRINTVKRGKNNGQK